MKYPIIFLILWFNFLPCFGYTTEGSKFAEHKFSEQNCLSKIHINVKREHTIENLQNIGEKEVSAITYGYGDLKTKEKICGKKKIRVSYICLLDKNCKPFWSCIYPSK